MGDDPNLQALHRQRVRALPIARLTKELTKKARDWGVNGIAIEDLLQGALLKLIKTGATDWDPGKDPTAFVFLLRAMEDALSAERKRKTRRRTDLDTEAVEASPPSSDPGPIRILLDREEATRARDELLARLQGSDLPLRIAQLCIAEGELRPNEIAARLGESVQRVYTALRRIGEEMASVRLAMGGREGSLKVRS